MCVAIIVNSKNTIDLADLKKMELHNPDGAGIGWADEGRVHWMKGLTAEDVHEWMPKLPRPLLIHFRYSTVGGKDARLCHPFPLNSTADTRIAGSSTAPLLIHNGHWGNWEKWRDQLVENHAEFQGPWSDTRLTAYLLAMFPDSHKDILNANGGRIAVIDAEGRVEHWTDGKPGGWSKVSKYKGMRFSNTYWEWSPRTTYGMYDSYEGCDYAYSRPYKPYRSSTESPDWSKVPRANTPEYGEHIPGFRFCRFKEGRVYTANYFGYYIWEKSDYCKELIANDGIGRDVILDPLPALLLSGDAPVVDIQVQSRERAFPSYDAYCEWRKTWDQDATAELPANDDDITLVDPTIELTEADIELIEEYESRIMAEDLMKDGYARE